MKKKLNHFLWGVVYPRSGWRFCWRQTV